LVVPDTPVWSFFDGERKEKKLFFARQQQARSKHPSQAAPKQGSQLSKQGSKQGSKPPRKQAAKQ
jgi:hypothetical protein